LQWKFRTACVATANLNNEQKTSKIYKFIKIVLNSKLYGAFTQWRKQSQYDHANEKFGLKLNAVSQSIITNLCGYHEYYVQLVQQRVYDALCSQSQGPIPVQVPHNTTLNSSNGGNNSINSNRSKLNVSALHMNHIYWAPPLTLTLTLSPTTMYLCLCYQKMEEV